TLDTYLKACYPPYQRNSHHEGMGGYRDGYSRLTIPISICMDWSYAAGFIDGEGSMGFAMDARTVGSSILPYITLTQAEKYRGFRAVHELAVLMESEGIKTYVYIVDRRGRPTVARGPYVRNYRTIKLHIRS